MSALPPSTDYTNSSITQGQKKAFMTSVLAYLSGLFGTAGTQQQALSTLGVPLNGTLPKTAAYTVVAADRGRLISCTNTWTLAIDDAAALGDFSFGVRNNGSGVITLDPYLSQTIDGALTITLAAGESCMVVCDGTAFRTVGKSVTPVPPDGQFRSIQVFTASGTWTKPTGLKRVKVTVVGGGGGGKSGSDIYRGGGGGGCAIKIIEAASLGTSEAVTRGAGGDTPSGTGGTSSFGAHCSATGGGVSPGVGVGGDLNLDGTRATLASSFVFSGGLSFFGQKYGGGGEGSESGSAQPGTNGIIVVEEFF